MKYLFNRNPFAYGQQMGEPSQEEIRATPSLFNASLEDALLYGGDLTREALSFMEFDGDKEHIIVDTKVHMLMPGMWPAIPGWHTDGVPRPSGKPNLVMQEYLNAPKFHLLVTGEGCLTDFLTEPLQLDVPDDIGSSLYEYISKEVNRRNMDPVIQEIDSCAVVMWDWWNIHRAKVAQKREWRYLIRVTETDHRKPRSDLRDVLRTQQQVYVPHEAFGW